MTTFTAFSRLTGKPQAEALGEALEVLENPMPYGVGVFEIEDGSGQWEIGSYFLEAPDEIALSLLSAAFGARDFVVSELPDTDWVAKVRRDLSPVEAGRFFVYGSHDADKLPEGRIGLLIEAAMAFGTGHHGTTLGCLKALDRLVGAGEVKKNIIDIGCGTAVLAMGAAHVYSGRIIASDIDPIAVDVAVANVAANDLVGRVDCLVAAGLDDPALAEAAPFDLVFANILKGPLIELSPDIAGACGMGAHVILSGILNEQADEIVSVYATNGLNLAHRDEHGEWTTLTLLKKA